jgi:hypothetical protein
LESPVIRFLRGFVLLSMLVAVPCIAVGWNQFAEIDWQRVLRVRKTESGHSQKTVPADILAAVKVPEDAAADFYVQNAFAADTPKPAVCLAEPAVSAVQQVAWQHSNVPPIKQQQAEKRQNFQTLEEHLKLLGVKSYKLEKWGSEGNLFRFSCLAAASGEYQYEKHFQEIGGDEMNVMRAVIGQIEKWKAGL